MATISTIGSFVADTALSLNRDWYILGGFMLVNGMMVDLFMITCIVQGWGLIRNVGRIFYAPKALTQLEMDALYAGDGADMYVVDRLQIVTKFAVMCYSAPPPYRCSTGSSSSLSSSLSRSTRLTSCIGSTPRRGPTSLVSRWCSHL